MSISAKSRPLTTKEIQGVKQLLQKGRNRYDNALLQIESTWDKLSPHDYARRSKMIKVVVEMAQIDQSLKVWENKLHE